MLLWVTRFFPNFRPAVRRPCTRTSRSTTSCHCPLEQVHWGHLWLWQWHWGGGAFWGHGIVSVSYMPCWLVATQWFFWYSPRTLLENDPIWRAYFSNGLVQPPTSLVSLEACIIEEQTTRTKLNCWAVDAAASLYEGRWGGFQTSFFDVHPYLEKIHRLTNIFQIRWFNYHKV